MVRPRIGGRSVPNSFAVLPESKGAAKGRSLGESMLWILRARRNSGPVSCPPRVPVSRAGESYPYNPHVDTEPRMVLDFWVSEDQLRKTLAWLRHGTYKDLCEHVSQHDVIRRELTRCWYRSSNGGFRHSWATSMTACSTRSSWSCTMGNAHQEHG